MFSAIVRPRALTAVLLSATALLFPSVAGSLADVTMADSETVAGTRVVLNGMGIREATMLKVKVYVMGLYLESKSTDANAIIASPQTKRAVQHYVRDVGAADLVNAWKESFAANNADMTPVKAQYDQFLACIADMKAQDRMIFDFVGDRVEVTVKGQKKAAITGTAFQQALLRVWLGPKPPCPALKTGILKGK